MRSTLEETLRLRPKDRRLLLGIARQISPYPGGPESDARGRRRSVKPDEVRREIKRLEDRRLRLAPEVMGGDRQAFEESRGLERRIVELAGAEREARADELREAWRKNHPGGGR